MDNPRIEEQITEEKKIEIENKLLDEDYKCYGKYIIIILFLILLCFLWCDNIDITTSINAEKWGQYGDLVGGLLGTFVGFISIKYLVTTLQEQKNANLKTTETSEKANSINIRSNELTEQSIVLTKYELFKGEFESVLKFYQDAIAEYKIAKKNSKDAFNSLIDEFLDEDFIYINYYIFRTNKALKRFNNFYIKYRPLVSVHFRLLYQLFALIHESSITEQRKRICAKSLRAQFSEQELIAIRYNCLNPYGEKMQKYVNHYNLLKHLPYTRLLEFRKWVSRFGNEREILNQLDFEIIRLKKVFKQLVEEERIEDVNKVIIFSTRYNMKIALTNKRCDLTIVFTRVHKKPYKRTYPFEDIFDKLSCLEIYNLLRDILYEFLIFSNFGKHNDYNSTIFNSPEYEEKEGYDEIFLTVSKQSQIILSHRQLDNPIA